MVNDHEFMKWVVENQPVTNTEIRDKFGIEGRRLEKRMYTQCRISLGSDGYVAAENDIWDDPVMAE